jgi:hypothetical protein
LDAVCCGTVFILFIIPAASAWRVPTLRCGTWHFAHLLRSSQRCHLISRVHLLLGRELPAGGRGGLFNSTYLALYGRRRRYFVRRRVACGIAAPARVSTGKLLISIERALAAGPAAPLVGATLLKAVKNVLSFQAFLRRWERYGGRRNLWRIVRERRYLLSAAILTPA